MDSGFNKDLFLLFQDFYNVTGIYSGIWDLSYTPIKGARVCGEDLCTFFHKNSKVCEGCVKCDKNASKKVLDETGVDGIIPSGELFDELLKNGIEKVHRDTFHASLGIGRYALALLWYKYFTGKDINDNSFNDFDEEVTDNEIATAKKCVNKLLD